LRSFPLEAVRVKIILTRDVDNVGEAGEVKDVAGGYARNYLIPKGLAIKASPGALKEFKRRGAAEARRLAKLGARAEQLAEQLADVTLAFEARAGETGRLYGSITTGEIAEALGRAVGETFDRRKHILSDPIREVGEHVVSVRLSPEVTVDVKAVVKAEGVEEEQAGGEGDVPAGEAGGEGDVPAGEAGEEPETLEEPAEPEQGTEAGS
jgi:large subunit ribosomal protein L9